MKEYMGNARKRKELFFKDHPNCCFCGGHVAATEEDHIPGRAFFRERQWPDGYVFPACPACNDASRYEEKILAFLVRAGVDDLNEIDTQELERVLSDIAKHDPEFLEEFREMTIREKRNFVKQRNIPRTPGESLGDFGVFTFGDRINSIVMKYARKISRALWYFHTGLILPENGTITVKWMTNATEALPEELLKKLFATVATIPSIRRNGKDLNDQFIYRFALATDKPAMGVFVWFRESFGFLSVISPDETLSPELDGYR